MLWAALARRPLHQKRKRPRGLRQPGRHKGFWWTAISSAPIDPDEVIGLVCLTRVCIGCPQDRAARKAWGF